MSSSGGGGRVVLTRERLISILAGGGAAAALASFFDDPRGYILGIIREHVVSWVLTAWSIVLMNVDRFGEILLTVYLEGVRTPFRESFIPLGVAILDSFEGIQTSIAGSLMGMGVGAPFALLIGFTVATVSYVILFSVLWSLLETYLPVGAVVDPLKAIVSLLTFGRFGGTDEETSTNGGSGGETNDQ